MSRILTRIAASACVLALSTAWAQPQQPNPPTAAQPKPPVAQTPGGPAPQTSAQNPATQTPPAQTAPAQPPAPAPTVPGGLNLTNAQYIASSIELNGGAQITMSVDPNSAVTLPELGLVGLIR